MPIRLNLMFLPVPTVSAALAAPAAPAISNNFIQHFAVN
jgi:hypothetical protein